jgi:lipopolysaccharide export system permease protein
LSRLDRYILWQLLTVWAFFTLILVVVLWVNRAVGLFDRLIGGGEAIRLFLEMTALSLPGLLRVAAPIGAFAAAVYVTNRLSRDSELAVVQATGFSPQRIARGFLAFGAVVAVAMTVLTNFLVPASRAAIAEREVAIARNASTPLLREGTFHFPTKGVAYFVSRVGNDGALSGILLSDRRDPAADVTYTAGSGRLAVTQQGLRLVLIDGMAQRRTTGTGRLALSRFADFSIDLGAMLPAPPSPRPDPVILSTAALLAADAGLVAASGRDRAAFLAEAHRRLSQPLLAPAVALIGFATLVVGGFSRFGLWRQIIGAVVLLILVQMAATWGQGQALRDEDRWPLLWLGPIVGWVIAAGLLFLAARPPGRRRGRGAVAAAGPAA